MKKELHNHIKQIIEAQPRIRTGPVLLIKPSLRTNLEIYRHLLIKDTEVLMKTNFIPIYFLYSNHRGKPTSFSDPLTVKNSRYDRILTTISRQLIFESTANDVFWVLHSKLQGKKSLECLPLQRNLVKITTVPT